jgi:hypothetical protein
VEAAVLADAVMLRQPHAGLPYTRVQADVADKILGVAEPAHIADRRHQSSCDD